MKKLRRPKHRIALELNDESGQIAISMPQASNGRKDHGYNTGSNARRSPAEPSEVRGEAYRRADRKGAIESHFARIKREFNFERSSWKGEPMNVSGSGHELTLTEFNTFVNAYIDRLAIDVYTKTLIPDNGALLITGRGPLDDWADGVAAPKSKSEGSHD